MSDPTTAGAGPRRVVVVGADGAGMGAAHQALRTAHRTGRRLEIRAFEATGHTSYSRCGIPYWLGGEVEDPRRLVARTAEEHRDAGIDLALHARVETLDLAAGRLTVRHAVPGEAEREEVVAFDELVLGTGAVPAVPSAWEPLPEGALPVTSWDEGLGWLRQLARVPAPGPVVVVGGGFIGLETAEALVRRGYAVTLLSRRTLLTSLDEAPARVLRETVEAAGVRVVEGAEVRGLEVGADGAVAAVVTDDETFPARLVAVATGVRPATSLGRAAGLPVGEAGGYLPDDHQRLAAGVWAAGDCCEHLHRIGGRRVFVPLGTHAVKQGRVLGDNLGGGDRAFPGVLGTAITRFAVGAHVAEVGRTGLSEQEARDAGLDAVALTTDGSTASGYLAEAAPARVHLVAERGTGRLLGGQVVGGAGAGKRVDTIAAALWGGLDVADLAWADLSYAPPFATAWEAVSLAARRLEERLDG